VHVYARGYFRCSQSVLVFSREREGVGLYQRGSSGSLLDLGVWIEARVYPVLPVLGHADYLSVPKSRQIPTGRYRSDMKRREKRSMIGGLLAAAMITPLDDLLPVRDFSAESQPRLCLVLRQSVFIPFFFYHATVKVKGNLEL
jgi:hypothetical protein